MKQRDEARMRHERSSMPMLSTAVIDACNTEKLTFDKLYQNLRDTDPCAAAWLRDETEYLAPANPAEKEKYALLALKLHHMLCRASEQ